MSYDEASATTTIQADGGVTVVVVWKSWRHLSTTTTGEACVLTRWAIEEDLNYNRNASLLYAETTQAWRNYLNRLDAARRRAMDRAYDDAYDAVYAAALEGIEEPTDEDLAAAEAQADAAGDAAARRRGDDAEFFPPADCPRETVLDSSVALLASKAFAESLTPPAPHVAPDGTAITGLPAYLETRRPVTQVQVHDLAMPIGTVRVTVTGTVRWWVDWDHRGSDDPRSFAFGAATTSGPHTITGDPWDEAAPDPRRHVWHLFTSSDRDVTVAVLDRWSVTASAPGFGTVGPVTLDDHLTTYPLDIRQGQVVRTD